MRGLRLKWIVVVIADPFRREQMALAKAAAIARRCGSRLVLFNSFMIPQPVADVPMDASAEILASAIRQRRLSMEKLAAGLRLRGARCVVEWDYPAHEAIVRQVLKVKADLLVTESHRHGRLSRWVLANTDWELMRTCPCPMWFARSGTLPKRPRMRVAVDPRHRHAKPARLDDRLLHTASGLARCLDGRVSLVHAYETPASAMPGMLMEPIRLPISPQRTRDFVARTTELVARLGDKYGIAPADRLVREGIAENVIASVSRGSDVLVMGAVSRSLLVRPVIGSTAERAIDLIECDLLVVKPAGFRTPVRRNPVKV